MIYTDKQVWAAVKIAAPKFKLDPYLVMAICEQECEHNIGKRGHRVFDITQYDSSVPRLEQKYMERYTRDFEYSTCVEGLLAMSYGTMQMMGESLRECFNDHGRNYYEWYFYCQTKEMQNLLQEPMSPFCVINALDYFCDHLETIVEWGCRWFVKKMKLAGGNISSTLLFWNGGSNKKYDDEVIGRMPRLKEIFPT